MAVTFVSSDMKYHAFTVGQFGSRLIAEGFHRDHRVVPSDEGSNFILHVRVGERDGKRSSAALAFHLCCRNHAHYGRQHSNRDKARQYGAKEENT
jgi:hypothetical protein